MHYNWQNKVVLITGSAMGIGWQLAQEFAQAGASVVLNARNKKRLKFKEQLLAEKGYKVTSFCGDVSDAHTCKQMIEHCITTFGKIDILINNAGLSAESNPVEEINVDVFAELVKVNFLGAVYCSKEALPYLKKTKGHLLFISSVAGIHGLGNYAAYCSSKMALTGFAESLQKELCDHSVSVGIAYIGFTENDPDKQVVAGNGIYIPQPKRNLKVASAKQVAIRLIKMIEQKEKAVVFSAMGKLLWYLNRLSPAITNKLLVLLYRKEQMKNQQQLQHA
ncbi:SDR family oxidoreductase [Lacibacter luteus]|uniref:SDR family oxidoreductase n=1 Tax=Lacibacter luteus TaxID=2508719 RepID=A0A4Q1CL66_9BACT|nr:SDR family oxidoreductase [Lacibacter luteus]RXK61474.1 SDR family oxidoreductase [Lacibacter luteus]